MDPVNMNYDERMKWKRLRRDFLNGIASRYTSLEEFLLAEEFNLTVMGYAAYMEGEYVSITISLDYSEYERYYVVQGKDSHLRVSNIIMWQDDCCANTYDYLGKAHLQEDQILIEGDS